MAIGEVVRITFALLAIIHLPHPSRVVVGGGRAGEEMLEPERLSRARHLAPRHLLGERDRAGEPGEAFDHAQRVAPLARQIAPSLSASMITSAAASASSPER